jgi:hypothetical protein
VQRESCCGSFDYAIYPEGPTAVAVVCLCFWIFAPDARSMLFDCRGRAWHSMSRSQMTKTWRNYRETGDDVGMPCCGLFAPVRSLEWLSAVP